MLLDRQLEPQRIQQMIEQLRLVQQSIQLTQQQQQYHQQQQQQEQQQQQQTKVSRDRHSVVTVGRVLPQLPRYRQMRTDRAARPPFRRVGAGARCYLWLPKDLIEWT